MQFERLMTEKILSNQNTKDEPTGIRIKINNNIIILKAIYRKAWNQGIKELGVIQS